MAPGGSASTFEWLCSSSCSQRLISTCSGASDPSDLRGRSALDLRIQLWSRSVQVRRHRRICATAVKSFAAWGNASRMCICNRAVSSCRFACSCAEPGEIPRKTSSGHARRRVTGKPITLCKTRDRYLKQVTMCLFYTKCRRHYMNIYIVI